MAYSLVTPRIGAQDIADTNTTQKHPLGTIVRAKDPTYGEGEFIYLAGVASTVVGSVVTYNALTGATTLLTDTASLNQPVAIAMSANVASQYGWYQIEGAAVVKKSAVAIAETVPLYTAGSGQVQAAAASGKQVVGMKSANADTVASAVGTVVATISRPHMQGSAV